MRRQQQKAQIVGSWHPCGILGSWLQPPIWFLRASRERINQWNNSHSLSLFLLFLLLPTLSDNSIIHSFIHLFERQSNRKWGETEISSTGLFPKKPQGPGQGQAKVRSQEFPYVCGVPRTWDGLAVENLGFELAHIWAARHRSSPIHHATMWVFK